MSGVRSGVPAVATGAYSRPVLSMRRASRGDGVSGASLGRVGEVVVSSKRVRRVTTRWPSGWAVSVEDGVGEVAVDLAEIFFLSVGESGFVAGGGEREQESQIDNGGGSGDDGGDAGEFWFAGEPEDEGRGDGKEEAADGGEESEDSEGRGEIHVAGDGGRHGDGSGK